MKSFSAFLNLVVLFDFLTIAECYKILGVFPTGSKSHYIVGGALMKGLAAAGHDVTVFNSHPQTEPLKNFRDITIQGYEKFRYYMSNGSEMQKMGAVELAMWMFGFGINLTNHTLFHDAMQDLLHDPTERFDLVICEVFLSDALLGLGQHFNVPIIAFSSFTASKLTTDLVGSPSPLSYVPNFFQSFSSHMSFAQRIANTWMALIDEIFMYYYLPIQCELYERAFPGKNKTDLLVLRKNVSLVLLNSHFTISNPRPYVPNMIEIGGIHINRGAPEDLPVDIWQFIESGAYHGVVYFSLGSNIKSSQLPNEVRDALLRAFSKLKQNVLWKWEEEKLPGKPENVLIKKWYPQNDVLAHPNICLFVTHGGLLSTTEAAYHGVPIIGIPLFADQRQNIAYAVNNGYALVLSYSNLTESSISWALDEMLGNSKYAQQAKIVSDRYRDQPLTPMETAVFWVEYVARHKGAPHMRSAGQDLSFVAYHNLDVFAFLLAAMYAFYWFTKLLIVYIFRKIAKSIAIDKKKID